MAAPPATDATLEAIDDLLANLTPPKPTTNVLSPAQPSSAAEALKNLSPLEQAIDAIANQENPSDASIQALADAIAPAIENKDAALPPDTWYRAGALLAKKERYQEARQCFEQAANGDHGLSEKCLGFMCANGFGEPTNFNKAKFWYDAAGKNGETDTDDYKKYRKTSPPWL